MALSHTILTNIARLKKQNIRQNHTKHLNTPPTQLPAMQQNINPPKIPTKNRQNRYIRPQDLISPKKTPKPAQYHTKNKGQNGQANIVNCSTGPETVLLNATKAFTARPRSFFTQIAFLAL
jgi:hypothetical protein